jgi:transposase-like protein
VRERAVALVLVLVLESQSDYGSQWETIVSVAQKVGVSSESLRRWVRQAEVDVGARAGTTSADAEALRELRREVRLLRPEQVHLRDGNESTVNQVISKRMVKKQQMRWTPRGAHLLLQVRTRVLNDTLTNDYRRWYPGFTHTSEADTLDDQLVAA